MAATFWFWCHCSHHKQQNNKQFPNTFHHSIGSEEQRIITSFSVIGLGFPLLTIGIGWWVWANETWGFTTGVGTQEPGL